MDLLNDLEYREERAEINKPVKKNIPLKLKSSSNLHLSNNNNQTINNNHNSQTPLNESNNNLNRSEPYINNNNIIINNGNNYQNQSFIQQNKNVNNIIPVLEQNNESLDIKYQNKKNHLVSTLNWNLNLNSISEKITEQTMDYCMICNLPILIYGRLIPCKHVMCIKCAKNIQMETCLKENCQEKIERIEPAQRGGIFVCNYDQDFKNNYSVIEKYRSQPDISQKKLCGRSYMSPRDLLAHIKHRHEPDSPTNQFELQS